MKIEKNPNKKNPNGQTIYSKQHIYCTSPNNSMQTNNSSSTENISVSPFENIYCQYPYN